MELKKINSLIHGKTKAYRIIMDDDEVFEVVRSSDPELTSKKEKKYDCDFYRNTNELIWFSTNGLNICSDRVKIHNLGENRRSFDITELNTLVTVAESSLKTFDLLRYNVNLVRKK